MTNGLLTVLFLLLPVAFVSGFFLGRRKLTTIKNSHNFVIQSGYLKGIDFLLNEQADKAIEIFIELLDVNNDTVETHLALGSLFRRRGEVDRAIRIHQNLIARPTLNKQQRVLALYQLGEDYMSAGLLDRAEALFSELIEYKPHTEAALLQLIDIYQQEKDWQKAIDVALRLQSITNKSYNSVISQYYCEQAEQSIRNGDSGAASKLLKHAININKQCVRASIIEGKIAFHRGDFKSALNSYQRVEHQDPDFLPMVIENIIDCYRKMNQIDDMKSYLFELQKRYASISLVLSWANVLVEEDREKAAEYIMSHLQQRASIRVMDRLIDLKLVSSSGSALDDLTILKNVTTEIIESKIIYNCNDCGFPAKTFHWQCPGCKGWNTIKSVSE